MNGEIRITGDANQCLELRTFLRISIILGLMYAVKESVGYSESVCQVDASYG